MVKILKNTTGSDIELDIGITVPANGQITLNAQDFDEASCSDDIVKFIGSGSIVVNNGSFDLSKSDSVRLIQGGFTNKIQIDNDLLNASSDRIKVDITGDATLIGPAGPKGDAGPAGFGIYAFSNTSSNGSILKARGLTINKTSVGVYQYTFTTPTPDTNYIVSVNFFNLGNNTDTNGFIDNKTVNGFQVTTGIGDNGTSPDTLTDTNHSVTVLGDAGPQGITSAYESWLDIGNVGTEADFLATLVGPQGPQGATGPQGPAGDSQIRVSPNDSTVGFIEDKLVSANNKISVTVINEGGDEDIQIQLQPANIGTSELDNDANFIDSAGAPVQPSDLVNFETSTELDARDVTNRNRANHTGTQTSSTISDFVAAVQSAESLTSVSFNPSTNIFSYTDENGTISNIDFSLFLDDTNLAQITSATLNPTTGIATFTRDDASTFDVDFSSLNDQSFISQAITNHEQTINNHDDVDTIGAVSGDLLRYNGSSWVPFKDFKAFARREDVLVSNQSDFNEYLSLSTTIPETGTYELIVNYLWSLDSTTSSIRVKVEIDNTNEVYFQVQEPKDSGGTGYNGTNILGNPENTGTDQRHSATYHDVITLTAGSHTIDLDFRTEVAGIEASLLQASIILKRF